MESSRKNKKRFSKLFDSYYRKLYNYAFKLLQEKDISEEVVQETFIKLWENIGGVSENDRSIESFLLVTLKNKVIDTHRKNQTREKHTYQYGANIDRLKEMDIEWELSEQIELIYTTLQPKTIEIFQLSRDNGLSYKEIAELKAISVKTVELHISKALTAFRNGLSDYL